MKSYATTTTAPLTTWQERKLYARGDHTSWNKQYYMPSSADLAVINWRKWIDRHGSNLPTLPKSAQDLPPLLPREQVFDRYNQHTKDCPHCSAALRNINIAIGVLAAVSAVALASVWVAVTAVTPAVPLVSTYNALHLGVAAVAGAVAGLLLKFRRKFIFEDYVHAEH
jgi:pheophorbide a oxygenase